MRSCGRALGMPSEQHRDTWQCAEPPQGSDSRLPSVTALRLPSVTAWRLPSVVALRLPSVLALVCPVPFTVGKSTNGIKVEQRCCDQYSEAFSKLNLYFGDSPPEVLWFSLGIQ